LIELRTLIGNVKIELQESNNKLQKSQTLYNQALNENNEKDQKITEYSHKIASQNKEMESIKSKLANSINLQQT
jgi:hypothetical protein